MNKKPTQNCPSCGTRLELNADSLADGLCPRCLLESSLHSTIAGQPKASPPPPVEEVSAAFPDLEIIELIGRGGMGAVYKARQKSLDRLVALKLLPLSLASGQEFAERFEAEAKALATLNHPNIVTVHDFGKQGDFYFLLMEYVDGPNLRNLLEDHRMTPDEALTIIPPVCQALEFAHKRNIVHCDIKPENLLLNTEGQVKIADFGIARILGQSAADTESEQTAGTPAYMAPEQMDSPHAIDTRADIYSLGVVFYEMLTGERPGKDFSPPSGKNTSVDIRLDKIVQRALAANPKLRWQSANALNSELQTILTQNLGEPKVTPPEKLPNSSPIRGWLAGTLAVMAVMLFVFGFFARNHVTPVPEPEHQAAIERWYNYWLDLAKYHDQREALSENTTLTKVEKKKEEEKLSKQYDPIRDESFQLWRDLDGLNDPIFDHNDFGYARLISGVLALVAFVLGYRHLSWLRGQKEPLPALYPGILGTWLCPVLFAILVIAEVIFRGSNDPVVLHPTFVTCALLFSIWTMHHALSWTRNLRNAPSFNAKQFVGVVLLGVAFSIPYSAGNHKYHDKSDAISEKYLEVERSYQRYIHEMRRDQRLSEPETLKEVSRRIEEYAQLKHRNYLLEARPFDFLMPQGDKLIITSILSLLAFAASITLILKSRNRRV